MPPGRRGPICAESRPFTSEHLAGAHGTDLVLHLHRLEDQQHLSGLHRVAARDQHGDDRARHRCGDLGHARRSYELASRKY
jgi:hypothetical protein